MLRKESYSDNLYLDQGGKARIIRKDVGRTPEVVR